MPTHRPATAILLSVLLATPSLHAQQAAAPALPSIAQLTPGHSVSVVRRDGRPLEGVLLRVAARSEPQAADFQLSLFDVTRLGLSATATDAIREVVKNHRAEILTAVHGRMFSHARSGLKVTPTDIWFGGDPVASTPDVVLTVARADVSRVTGRVDPHRTRRRVWTTILAGPIVLASLAAGLLLSGAAGEGNDGDGETFFYVSTGFSLGGILGVQMLAGEPKEGVIVYDEADGIGALSADPARPELRSRAEAP